MSDCDVVGADTEDVSDMGTIGPTPTTAAVKVGSDDAVGAAAWEAMADTRAFLLRDGRAPDDSDNALVRFCGRFGADCEFTAAAVTLVRGNGMELNTWGGGK